MAGSADDVPAVAVFVGTECCAPSDSSLVACRDNCRSDTLGEDDEKPDEQLEEEEDEDDEW